MAGGSHRLLMAEELFQETNPGTAADLGIGPTFDELLDVSRRYLDSRVATMEVGGIQSDRRDVGIYYWRRQALDALDTAIRGAASAGVKAVPIHGNPEWLDTANLRRFQWTGSVANGKRCHTNKVPCHTNLEKHFADFLDRSKDVIRYFKNERLGVLGDLITRATGRGSTSLTSSSRRVTLTVAK